MAALKKYFKTRKEATWVCVERNRRCGGYVYGVYRMPKGTRHHGEYAVCTYVEYLNTY